MLFMFNKKHLYSKLGAKPVGYIFMFRFDPWQINWYLANGHLLHSYLSIYELFDDKKPPQKTQNLS